MILYLIIPTIAFFVLKIADLRIFLLLFFCFLALSVYFKNGVRRGFAFAILWFSATFMIFVSAMYLAGNYVEVVLTLIFIFATIISLAIFLYNELKKMKLARKEKAEQMQTIGEAVWDDEENLPPKLV